MPFNISGIYTPPSGAESAFPGQVIASATWNAIFTDISSALSLLGEVFLAEPTIKTTAGPFVVTNELMYILNKAAPSITAITLPAVATRNQQWLMIVDWGGNAGDITLTPAGGQTIQGQATWIIGSGGKIILVPSTSLSGWIVLQG